MLTDYNRNPARTETARASRPAPTPHRRRLSPEDERFRQTLLDAADLFRRRRPIDEVRTQTLGMLESRRTPDRSRRGLVPLVATYEERIALWGTLREEDDDADDGRSSRHPTKHGRTQP